MRPVQDRTIVEAAVSTDSGKEFSFGPLIQLTLPNGDQEEMDPQNEVGGIGQFFRPCESIGGMDSESRDTSYFGDYISGAFKSDDKNDGNIWGVWTDSRLGCISQPMGNDFGAIHQHVYAGGPLPR